MARAAPLALSVVACVTACASSPSAYFEGASAPRIISTEGLQQHTYVPHDHVAIGTVTASCQRDRGDLENDTCSEFELLRSMRETAAEAGGTAFVAPSCRYEAASPQRRWIHCSATVARERSRSPSRGPTTAALAPQERRWEVRIEGRAIRVTARPGARATPRPRPVQEVRRVWNPAPDSERVGTVRATCMETCHQTVAARGLEQGAAWLGAQGVANVRCVQSTPGRWTCMGDAVSP